MNYWTMFFRVARGLQLLGLGFWIGHPGDEPHRTWFGIETTADGMAALYLVLLVVNEVTIFLSKQKKDGPLH